MSVEVGEEPIDTLAEHGTVPIAFSVDRVLVPKLIDGGLGGLTLSDEGVAEPWVKDYDSIKGEGPSRWARRFDVSRWGLLVARDAGERVGGLVVAFGSPEVHMLDDREDLAVVWDLRVRPTHRGTGVGTMLWHAAEAWARARQCRHLKVETQNINVGACHFYARMGCTLGAIDRFGYFPALPDETMLLWYRDLT